VSATLRCRLWEQDRRRGLYRRPISRTRASGSIPAISAPRWRMRSPPRSARPEGQRMRITGLENLKRKEW